MACSSKIHLQHSHMNKFTKLDIIKMRNILTDSMETEKKRSVDEGDAELLKGGAHSQVGAYRDGLRYLDCWDYSVDITMPSQK